LYVPGGVFAPPSSFTKRLVIYGTGHYPDTTSATGKSVISGNLRFQNGSDSSFVEGLEVTGDIYTDNNHKVDYLTVSRCKLNSFMMNGNMTTPSNYATVRQSVLNGSVIFSNGTFNLVTNNIILGYVSAGNNNAMYNNIFLWTSNYYHNQFASLSNCHIANNIIKHTGYITNGNLNTFSNNAFPSGNPGGTNSYINNYFNQPFDSLFVETIPASFDYDTDYFLDSASNYLGTDSTEIGIYGGLYPWKKSSVPSIPHIIYKKIPVATEPNGTLDIEIKVNAEDY
ncbi:MAG: hypothetical protein KJP21_09585, partial [Bacteroidia bacterium]|nr:hypothetical protein [Bacteroidia bacterium]